MVPVLFNYLDMRNLTEAAMTDADLCRSHGWGPGTRLVGDEGYGPTVIEITAVGEKWILAKTLSHRGEQVDPDEGFWTLSCRKWKKVPK